VRIRNIPDPGSRIPYPKTATKERGEKKFVVILLCSHKFHKIENYYSFEVLKKNFFSNFKRITELFTQKLSLSSQKYGFGIRDPGYEIRDPEKTYPGSRIPDPQH
jgi:hypothetical protein